MIPFLQKNKVSLILVTIFISIYGIFSLMNIPKEAQPSINLPYYNVSVVYPGADPSTIEEQVINKLEQRLKSISMVKKINSSSLYNMWFITLEFYKWKSDVDATNDIKSVIDQVYQTLPSDAKYPMMKRVNINDSSVYTFSVAWPYPTEIIYEKIKILEDNIKSIPWVSELVIVWKPTQQIKIDFDMQKVSELDLDFWFIISQLKSAFVKYPTDKKDVDGKLYSFEVTNYEANLTWIVSQVKDYDIVNKDSRSIKVKDIATVMLSYKKNDKKSYVITDIASWKSMNALSFQITKIPNYSVEQLVKDLKFQVDEFSKTNNKFKFVETLSQEESISKMYNLFLDNFLETWILVFIIILIFLGRRSSIVIVISFLIVYLANFGYLKAIWYSFNNIVSFSLILVLWVMIDNLIVISQGIVVGLQKKNWGIEELRNWNIIEEWVDKSGIWFAIKDSLKNYARPIIFGTSTTIAVFVPLYFGLSGVMWEYMRPMPVTIISNLVISLFITLMVLPLISTYFSGSFWEHERFTKIKNVSKLKKDQVKNNLKSKLNKSDLWQNFLDIYYKIKSIAIFLFGEEKKSLQRLEKLWHKFADRYWKINNQNTINIWKKVINWNHAWSKKTVIIFILFFISSFFLFWLWLVKFEFMGNIDSNNIWINLKYAPGIKMEENQNNTSLITKDIIWYFNKNYPNTLMYASVDLWKQFAMEWGSFAGTNQSSITFRLVDWKERNTKSYTIVENLQKYIDSEVRVRYPFAQEIAPITAKAGGWWWKAISFSIIWDDYIKINDYIQKILPEIKKINWIYNLSTSIEYTNWKIKYYIDENRAKQLWVSDMSVITAMIWIQNSNYEPNGIKIKDFNEFGKDPIPLNAYVDLDGNIDSIKFGKIYLSQIVKSKKLESEINSIVRLNWEKNISISADKVSNVALSDITTKINEIIQNNPLSNWLKYSAGWDIESQAESMADTWVAMIIGLLLMFMVLIVQFNNIKYAAVIIGSVFLSIGWAIVILVIFRYNMTFPAILWLFWVLWVWVNQALIHIEDFKEFYEKDWLSVVDSFRKSIAERFIPIFLTKITTIVWLVILAMKDELFGSMAIAFIWWLIVSFFITLFYIPSLMNLVSKEYYIRNSNLL